MNTSSFKFENLLLICLPLLLIFFRSIADITVLIIGLIFLYRSYNLNDWSWLKQKWFIFSLIFWLYLLLINAPLSINTSESFLYSLAFIRWPLFAMALSMWLLHDHKSRKKFLLALLFTLSFVLIDVWWQYIFEFDLFGNPRYSHNIIRLTGPFRDNPVPGIFLARYLFLLLYLGYFINYLQKPSRNVSYILLILFLGSLTIYITGERMALIIFVAGSSLVSIGLFLQYKSIRKHILLSLFLIISLLVISQQAFPKLNDRMIIDLLYKLSNFASSDYMLVFKSAYAVWIENPILGSGFHQYREACINLGYFGSGGGVCYHPHNISLELLSETGIIGFLLYFIMIGTITFSNLHSLLQKKEWLLLTLSFNLIFVSFFPLIAGMSLFNNWIGSVIWLLVGWSLVTSRNHKTF
jgi:O-antigen ligase